MALPAFYKVTNATGIISVFRSADPHPDRPDRGRTSAPFPAARANVRGSLLRMLTNGPARFILRARKGPKPRGPYTWGGSHDEMDRAKVRGDDDAC